MVNNDDDGLWGLLKINMNMRVYRERQRQRRDKERNIFWDCVFFWLITIVEKGLEGDLIQKDKFIRERGTENMVGLLVFDRKHGQT